MVYGCGPQSSGIKILLLIASRLFLTSDMGVAFQGVGHWGALSFGGSYIMSIQTGRQADRKLLYAGAHDSCDAQTEKQARARLCETS